jgi:hypothetical protein
MFLTIIDSRVLLELRLRDVDAYDLRVGWRHQVDVPSAPGVKYTNAVMSSEQAIDHPLQLGARDIERKWATLHLRACVAQHDAASAPDCIMEVTPPHSLRYAAICVRV